MVLEHRKHHPHFPDGMTEAGKGLYSTPDKLFVLQTPSLMPRIHLPYWGPPPTYLTWLVEKDHVFSLFCLLVSPTLEPVTKVMGSCSCYSLGHDWAKLYHRLKGQSQRRLSESETKGCSPILGALKYFTGEDNKGGKRYKHKCSQQHYSQ